MNDVGALLRGLFPPDTTADWNDVLHRARTARSLRRPLVALAVLIAMIVAVGSALALTGRLGDLFHGFPVRDLTPKERYILSELDAANGKVELIAERGSRLFYLIRQPDGRICYSIGESRKGLTPAQAEVRPRFGGLSCLAKGMFPSARLPVLSYPYFRMKPGEQPEMMGVEGFAADPVAKIGVIGRDNTIVITVPVDGNVFTDRSIHLRGGRGLVALDGDAHVLWVQCSARGGCGRYKSTPLPSVPKPPHSPAPAGPVVVQRGKADGVSVVVRGSDVQANFSGLSPSVERLLRGTRDEITLGCFRLVTFGGKRFSDGVGVSRAFASFLRVRFGAFPGRRYAAPFDGCIATGMYGHTWNDAHGTHDLVEVPLSAKGRRYFVERAVARDIGWLGRARVFRPIRYAQRPFTSAGAAHYLGERVVALASPAATPPLGRLGIWLGPNRRIVVAELAPTGRRFFLEFRRGVIYRTNLVGFIGTF